MGKVAGEAGDNVDSRGNRAAYSSRNGYPADRGVDIIGIVIGIFTAVGDNYISRVANPKTITIIYFMHGGVTGVTKLSYGRTRRQTCKSTRRIVTVPTFWFSWSCLTVIFVVITAVGILPFVYLQPDNTR